MNLSNLDYKCSQCEGSGVIAPLADTCENCKGTGYILTEEGVSLLAFLHRHLTLTEENLEREE